MKYFSSQPHWWPAAQQQGLVQGDAAPVDAHEPSVLVIAMAMLGVLVCMVPLLAFVFLGLGEEVAVLALLHAAGDKWVGSASQPYLHSLFGQQLGL